MLHNIIKMTKKTGYYLSKLMNLKIFNKCPDSLYLYIKYFLRTGKKLNLSSPTSYNEKIQWLKLNDRKPEYTRLVDKYEVRDFISSKIGEEYLIPLVSVWENVDDINFAELPDKFVLKCTHNSAGLVICKDKKRLNFEEAKIKLKKLLEKNFYYYHREWPYKDVKPRVICEKYMVDETGEELKDYKFYCFHGEPKVIQVDYNRFTNHKRNLYDVEWNYIPASIQYETNPNIQIAKPKKLEKMIELSKILSEGYHHIRIDFYSINEKIYFGEMTFYSEAGVGKFQPEEFGLTMGNLINLPV